MPRSTPWTDEQRNRLRELVQGVLAMHPGGGGARRDFVQLGAADPKVSIESSEGKKRLDQLGEFYDNEVKRLRKNPANGNLRSQVAPADIWVTQAIERLESHARREASLPAAPRVRAEAKALQAAAISDILGEASYRLKPVYDLLPSFESFQGRKDPPSFSQVMGWLHEIKAILDVLYGTSTGLGIG